MPNGGIIFFNIQRIWPRDLSRTWEKAETVILLNTSSNTLWELDNEWFVQAWYSLQRFINSQIATTAITVKTKRVGEIPLVFCPDTLSQYFKWWTIRTDFPSCWIPQEKLHSHLQLPVLIPWEPFLDLSSNGHTQFITELYILIKLTGDKGKNGKLPGIMSNT